LLWKSDDIRVGTDRYRRTSVLLFVGENMEEDGKTIFYTVLKDGAKAGEFKVLSLGIEQIKRTCDVWGLDIFRYQIVRNDTREVVWDGRSIDSSS
jgi:hypothetical protein